MHFLFFFFFCSLPWTDQRVKIGLHVKQYTSYTVTNHLRAVKLPNLINKWRHALPKQEKWIPHCNIEKLMANITITKELVSGRDSH